MEERCKTEIIELHQFFQDWFNGTIEAGDENFARMAGVLSENFVIIGPNGELTERESLLHGLRNAYKSRKVVKIWIENFQTYRREGDLIITTYEEWQQGCDDSVNARISTAIFQEKPDTPNGVMWLHVHETWLKK